MRSVPTADLAIPHWVRFGRFALVAGVVLAVGVRFGADGRAADQPKAPAPAITPEQASFFETKVRPVLVERCASCHGATDQGGGLRVDSRAALLEGGEAGPAIVPGDPDGSPLIRAVRHQGDNKMPPKKAGAKLADPVAEGLAHWVRMGAPWPEGATLATQAKTNAAASHWAYQPVVAPPTPSVSDPKWVQSPVDAFILAALDAKHLAPSAAADRRTLIRRVTFDLTGLPPTVAEVDAFLADQAPDAYGKVVDRLLSSPRYGERWGRHWLDVARFADSKGYSFVSERRFPYSYTYRDYVIRAFNDDKPYDQFVVEQIAADRLPESGDRRNLAALGFLTVGRSFLGDTNDIIDDRIDVVTRGFLGLSVACARCHDHKFDPIPTEDYYSLHGVFASSVEPGELPLIPDATPSAERPAFDAERDRLMQAVTHRRNDYLAAIEREIRRNLASFCAASFAIDFNPQNPKLDEVARDHKVSPERLRFVARRLGKLLAKDGNPHDPITGPYVRFARIAAADFTTQASRLTYDLTAYLDADHPVDPAVVALFDTPNQPPADLAEVARRYGTLFERAARAGEPQPIVGPPSTLPDPTLAAVQSRLGAGDTAIVPLDASNPALARGADRILNRLEREKVQELEKKVDELAVTHPGAPPRAMVLNDRPQPGDSRIAIRGNPGRPGNVAPRRFLRVLSGGGAGERAPFQDGSGRLELARAIASPANPLTARVLVNRVWHHHFGAGLVATPSDFGARGELPSHPELLDDLAARFVRGGWSVKNLHRLIVLSATYQQRSEGRSDLFAADPDNRLVGRFPSHRLDFESMRDSTLLVAGALDPTMGGRGVDLFPKGPVSTRRTVYGYVDRYDLDPTYRTFDFPSPDISAPLRPTTTVPQQALFLLNSPFLLDQAKRLAHRADLDALPDADARVRRLYQDLFSRPATDHEVALARQFTSAEATRDGGPTPWELYAQVLLMTNEFATID